MSGQSRDYTRNAICLNEELCFRHFSAIRTLIRD